MCHVVFEVRVGCAVTNVKRRVWPILLRYFFLKSSVGNLRERKILHIITFDFC